ncbi:MAG: hypothetical protein WB791_03840 [Waddliaceae bacterium]
MINHTVMIYPPYRLQYRVGECFSNPSNQENSEDLLRELNKDSSASQRYAYPVADPHAACLKAIFDRAWKSVPEALILSAKNKCGASWKSNYPTWKKVCWIQLPKGIARLAGNLARAVSLARDGHTTLVLYFVFYSSIIPLIFLDNAAPYAPLYVTALLFHPPMFVVAEIILWAIENPVFAGGLALTSAVALKLIPNHLLQEISNRLNLIRWVKYIFMDGLWGSSMFLKIMGHHQVVERKLQEVSNFFSRVARKADFDRNRIEKAQVYTLWLEEVKELANPLPYRDRPFSIHTSSSDDDSDDDISYSSSSVSTCDDDLDLPH